MATLAELARHNKLLAKTNEAERLTLYKQTGGNPLLLRWVAGQLGRGSCRTFIEALHFLSTCPSGNDPLEFVFGDLVEEFTPEETRVLCALTYFTLPAKGQHIADVADLEKERKRPLPLYRWSPSFCGANGAKLSGKPGTGLRNARMR